MKWTYNLDDNAPVGARWNGRLWLVTYRFGQGDTQVPQILILLRAKAEGDYSDVTL